MLKLAVRSAGRLEWATMTTLPETCTGDLVGKSLVVTVLATQLREAQIAYKLRDDVIALIGKSQPPGVVLDLSKVSFIGSVGFLAFLGVRRHLQGGRIVLCNLSAPIRDMFGACRLIATDATTVAPFETANTAADALALLNG